MPHNYEISLQPATRGDVADLALNVAIVLHEIKAALLASRSADVPELTRAIQAMDERADKLSKMFDKLVEWRSE